MRNGVPLTLPQDQCGVCKALHQLEDELSFSPELRTDSYGSACLMGNK